MHHRVMKILPLLFLGLLLVAPVAAMTMGVSGETQGQAVIVTLDREALTSFTLNNGTPVYAYGSTVKFVPANTGTLTIAAVSGIETIEKTIPIKASGGGPGGDGDDPSKWRTVTVSPGTVSITAHNNGKTYLVDRLTVLGVLDASGVSYTATDEEWGGDGLFVDSVDGQKGVFPAGWMYQINGIMGGPVQFQSVGDGDEIVWYYSQSMSDTPANSNRCIYMKVRVTGGTPGGSSTEEQSGYPMIRNTSLAGQASSVLKLPVGASISDTSSGRVLTLDTRKAADAGEKIRYDGNTVIITCDTLELRIHLADLVSKNGIVTGVIENMTVSATPVRREIEGVGTVSSSFLAGLNTVPAGASIGMRISGKISRDLRTAFVLCALDRGRSVSTVAYVVEVDTGTLADGVDIGAATVTMAVPPDWVEAHGGRDAIVILHQSTDGTVEALATRYMGLDDEGNMLFAADSPGGLSIFALAASSATAEATGTTSVAGQTPTTTSPVVPSNDLWFFAVCGVCLFLTGGVAGYFASRYGGRR